MFYHVITFNPHKNHLWQFINDLVGEVVETQG